MAIVFLLISIAIGFKFGGFYGFLAAAVVVLVNHLICENRRKVKEAEKRAALKKLLGSRKGDSLNEFSKALINLFAVTGKDFADKQTELFDESFKGENPFDQKCLHGNFRLRCEACETEERIKKER